jgi:hypothetical protein
MARLMAAPTWPLLQGIPEVMSYSQIAGTPSMRPSAGSWLQSGNGSWGKRTSAHEQGM